MTQAKVTKQFPGVPDEETKVRDIKVGEVITGKLAQVALQEGWADEVATAESGAEGEDGVDLDTLKIDGLKDFASKHGIDLGDAKKKDEILAAIKKAVK
jgi:hypothetical protein